MIRAYVAHPIRGSKGPDATCEDMEANNQAAHEFADRIRAKLPNLDLYVPGEHDEFVMSAYEMGILDEKDILAVDIELLAKRDILIVYSPTRYIGGGVGAEIAEAQRLGMPWTLTHGGLEPIRRLLESAYDLPSLYTEGL